MSKRRRTTGFGAASAPPDAEQLPTKRRRTLLERIPSSSVDGSSKSLPRPQSASAEAELSPEHDLEYTPDERYGPIKRSKLSHVAISGPAYPLSLYESWEPPLELTSEVDALPDLKDAHRKLHEKSAEQPPYTYFTLDQFSVYLPPTQKRHANELVTLDRLRNRGGYDEFRFDGILSCGNESRRVKGAPFSILTIEGYRDEEVFDLRNKICIQTTWADRHDAWYQLGTPAPEYERFYTPFHWLAHFTKCFVDYLSETDDATLDDFRRRFFEWVQQRFDAHPALQPWLAQANLQDFRTTVAANVGFLWKECHSLYDDDALAGHPIWGEVDPARLTAIPRESPVEKGTVVTPYAYDCFRKMYFSGQLEVRQISDPAVLEHVRQRKSRMRLTPLDATGECELALRTPKSLMSDDEQRPLEIRKGDVVALGKDESGPWKSTADTWYAYVQAVRINKRGQRVLDVLWMYHPADTTIGAAYYPFKNELFLSDNCGCRGDAISADEATSKVEVAWNVSDPATITSGFFVRQKFRTVHEEEGAYSFETLKDADFRCQCDSQISAFNECISSYKVGSTVLVIELANSSALERTGSSDSESESGKNDGHLEPAQIVAFDYKRKRVSLRRLLRKAQANSSAPPNELELTPEIYSRPPSRVARKCNVRLFGRAMVREGLIPTPYNRGGAVDCFYIVCEHIQASEPVSAVTSAHATATQGSPTESSSLPPMSQGWDPQQPSLAKLEGLGIFCGGGNLDRGLEDGSGVEFKCAVDWNEHALHSYRANASSPDVQYFLGSVDDYLAHAIAGVSKANVARVGSIDVLAAGSPCPGFSLLQIDKLSPQSLKNASMVASVIAHVDLYSPKYFVLENVIAMTQGMGESKKENVFSQILAALVGLGYQVQQLLMDAWSYSSSQQRSRVFIVATVPGLTPPPPPPRTHGHPVNMRFIERSLGRSSSGKPFGIRRDDYTPFPHVPILESCKDLPDISDSQPQMCPAFPDHRTPTEENGKSRARIALVPLRPYGMGLVQAHTHGHITGGEPLEYFNRLGKLTSHKDSTTYARLHPEKLCPTLTTALRICDGVGGRTMHWQQNRSITVMECRRQQGYRDHEVLVGTPAQQMKIIGNSVDRSVSLTLGTSIREAWEKSQAAEPPPDARTGACLLATPIESESESEIGEDERLVQRSREGKLMLNDAQVEDVRAHGFKAILRMLGSSPRT